MQFINSTNMEEIWKDVPGYEGLYQVSNYGEVKSLGNNASRKEKILKPSKNVETYLKVALWKDGNKKTIKIHQLVTMAFLGHIPNGYEIVVNHIDNNPLNNYIGNLELVTVRYNSSCHKTDVGIYWNKRDKRWSCRIVINYKIIHLGYFIEKQHGLNIYQKALANMHLYNGDNKEFRNKLKQL